MKTNGFKDRRLNGPGYKHQLISYKFMICFRAGSGIAWIQSDSDELEKEPAKPRLTAAVLRV